MEEQKQEIAKQDNNPVRAFFASEGVTKKFQDILGDRAQAFVTSVLQVANSNDRLKACTPMSIFNAAATAAVLDLPVNQNLGFSWLVPYNGEAQFQIGYKGFIQLAQRSGQYARIITAPIYKNQFKSWNPITEDLQIDGTVEGEGGIVGYFAYFRLLNGYEKVSYWPREKVVKHAQRFSKNFEGKNSIWQTDFDKMAMKTVLKNVLSQWGPLSVQMEKAIQFDQAVIKTVDGSEFEYPDNTETPSDRANKALDSTKDSLKGVIKRGTEKKNEKIDNQNQEK